MGTKIRTYHDLLDRNDEMSAYLFGFWMADGNIFLSRSGRRVQKNFQLYNTDRRLMFTLGRLFGKKPCMRVAENATKPCYNIKVKSDRLFDRCYGLVGGTSKSDKSVPLPDIDPILFHHFVRGFFDGDGSIFVKRYKNRHGVATSELGMSFTAGKDTGDFLERLRDAIRLHVSVGRRKISGKKNRKLPFAQYDTMLMCEWMYQNASVYMHRKKRVWDSADKERLAKSKKWFSNKV